MSKGQLDVEILIIGAGPGGLTASIYAIRARRKCLLLDKTFPGGQLNYTAWIENFPGFPQGSVGMELAGKITEQVKNLGVEIVTEEVTALEVESRSFTAITPNKEIKAGTVIIGTGASWRKLGVPGEKELAGKGVSYCATCDGMFYRDREVVVVGGGDTAICEALFLTRFVKRLYLIHRRDELRAEKILQERTMKNEKISIVWNSVATKIIGEDKVEAVELFNKKTRETSVLPTDGVFIFVGNVPNTDFVPDSLKKDNQGRIITNLQMETNVPGLYAIGDCRTESIRQVVSAAGDGATAAWYADKYLDSLDE